MQTIDKDRMEDNMQTNRTKNDKEKGRMRDYLLLHALLVFYSVGAIFSKMAAGQPLFSFRFILYYGIVLCNLACYAMFWQQILKRIPLTVAFANKAVTIVWGLIWGFLFFQEAITIGKVLGSLLIIAGVLIVVTDHE